MIRRLLGVLTHRRPSMPTESARAAALVEAWPVTCPSDASSNHIANPLEAYFDGVTEGPGVWKWRHYFEIYHRHLERFVGTSPVLVEVGVHSGGSMPMWHHYFGKGAHVHGIDIEPACLAYATPTTTIHIGDQSDPAFWQKFIRKVPQVDVLIDDGGHAPEQQMATLEAILPRLRPGGVYICEDVTGTDNRFLAFVQNIADALHAYAPSCGPTGNVSPASAFQAAIHSLHVYPFVIVIEKRDQATRSFSAPKHGTHWLPYL